MIIDIGSAWDWEFIEKMRNSIRMSHFKYEKDLKKSKNDLSLPVRDEAKNAMKRLQRYIDDGNTEHLIDVSSFCMLEFKEMTGKYIPTDNDPESKIIYK